MAMQINKVW